MAKSPYEVLGVPPNATAKEIKAAYHRLALRFHPDKVTGDQDAKAAATQTFAEISHAYEILTNPNATEHASSSQEYESSNSDRNMGTMSGMFSSPFFYQQQRYPFAPFFFGGSNAGSSFFGGESSFLNPFFQFTDPFVLFEQTFGRHAFDLNQTDDIMAAFQASDFPSSNGGAGFSVAFASSSTQSIPDPTTGGYRMITNTTQMVNGKKTTRTETTLVYPDGRRETKVEVQQANAVPRLAQGVMGERDALPLHNDRNGQRFAPSSPQSAQTYRGSAHETTINDSNRKRTREQRDAPTWGDRLREDEDVDTLDAGNVPVDPTVDSSRKKRRKLCNTGECEAASGTNNVLAAFDGETKLRTEVHEVVNNLVTNVEASVKHEARHPAGQVKCGDKNFQDTASKIVPSSTEELIPKDSEVFVSDDSDKHKMNGKGDSAKVGPTDTNSEAEFLPIELSRLTVAALRRMLRIQGLKVSGNKAELIDRLLRPCDH